MEVFNPAMTRMKARGFCVAVLLSASVLMFAQTTDSVSKPEWHHSVEENPLYGKSFDRFTLAGTYFKAPSTPGSETSKLIVSCEKGKFASGEFSLGAVAKYSGLHSLKGAQQAQVDLRIDDRKKTAEWLEISNDRKTLFFDKIQLIQFMTGKMLGHPSDNNSLTHRLVLGVVEELGNEVIVTFEMPADASEMVRSCSLDRKK
jgi:hypothetical protein